MIIGSMLRNSLGFTVSSVTSITIAVYIGLFTGLLYVHHTVPSAPNNPSPFRGINITEAWLDLKVLSDGYHPYNSHRNDKVRTWLLNRINAILTRNGIKYETHTAVPSHGPHASKNHSISPVIIYDDLLSNATYTAASPISVYFEGTNVLVYVRGSEDDDESYLKCFYEGVCRNRAVLVNAHYDSVSTGFGATDDGVGVVSILQLINYFTKVTQQPKRGLLALFNNGEEDYLNGAYAFTQHPSSKLPDTFLNLEGAGAGGRAALFRSTDYEVTKSYGNSPYPFGTVLSADAFRRGVVRSQTDYVVFNGNLSLRGLDVAFTEPRASYHTWKDSTKFTSEASLWHMLSAALETTKGLTSDTTTDFGPDSGSDSIWFDAFGHGFGLIKQDAFFAISVILLVLQPLFLGGIIFALVKQNKLYLFERKRASDPLDAEAPDEQVFVRLEGWRGFTRFPIAFVLATVCSILLALLISHVNPYIVYSSQYSVWTMSISVWVLISWSLLRGADFLRASALHRAYSLSWIFLISWTLLVFATWAQRSSNLAGTYGFLFLNAGAFIALCTTYVEFFALPPKQEFVTATTHNENTNRRASQSENISRPESAKGRKRTQSQSESRPSSSARRLQDEDVEATETTSLLQHSRSRRLSNQLETRKIAYGDEQTWSANLPSWTWLIQFILLGPVVIIFFGQIGLFLTSGTHQTPADGNPVLPIYMAISILTVVIFTPITPFLHRIHRYVPMFLFLTFVGTLIYNLTAFPFSEKNQLKVYFSQELDLDTGFNHVNLTSVPGYGQKIIASIPSAQGQEVNCSMDPHGPRGPGLETCQWRSLHPNVGSRQKHPEFYHRKPPLISLTTTRSNTSIDEATFKISGHNTRACKLKFHTPISNYEISGASPQDPRLTKVPEGGTSELRLWSREWGKSWHVNVTWVTPEAALEKPARETLLTGRAICLWNDENQSDTIPALTELKQFMPIWSIVTKAGDGLLEASKAFEI